MHRSTLILGTALTFLASCSDDVSAPMSQPGTPPSELDAPLSEDASRADESSSVEDVQLGRTSAPLRDGGGCASLPPRDCTGSPAQCAEIIPFEPTTGLGYENYPINGETAENQYRSFARVDLVMLVEWAAAYTACKTASWTEGNGGPVGLGDMSESDGSIPGTSLGSPGHPQNTHVNGYDMDIGYFQSGTADNRLRPVCPHSTNGVDSYHCTDAPTTLDVKRTSVFLGALLSSARVRVIGVDGKIGPLVTDAMQHLCTAGIIPAAGCANKARITWEATDTGAGWYLFHHHHLHVSLKRIAATTNVRVLGGEAPLRDLDLIPAFGLAPERSH